MPQRPFTIVAFGDSITAAVEVPEAQRWTSLLGESLRPRGAVVINAGVGGNTSREGLARMQRDVLERSPDLVFVQFGGNDGTPEVERFVPLEEYRANLATIKARLDGAERGPGQRRVVMVLLTFPPIVDHKHSNGKHEHFRPAGGPDRFLEAYRQATRGFAREHGLALVDSDAAVRANLEGHVLGDGVHLTPAGNRAVAEAVLGVVGPMIA